MSRGLWTRETVAILLVAAIMPLALFWVWFGGPAVIARLGLCLLVVGVWHLVFMLARAQAPSIAGVLCALAVAMLAPQELGVFQMVLGLSFGVVMSELVFGGWGRNVVNPATVALSFLGFGFPSFAWPMFDAPVAWAAIPAALLGVAMGVMPFGVLAGAALVACVGILAGCLPEPVVLSGGVVLVLLVADPVTSAATTLGRWINGALFTGLLALFAGGWDGAAPIQIAVAAALLSSLAAPLLDEAALAVWVHLRRRRHGRT